MFLLVVIYRRIYLKIYKIDMFMILFHFITKLIMVNIIYLKRKKIMIIIM